VSLKFAKHDFISAYPLNNLFSQHHILFHLMIYYKSTATFVAIDTPTIF